MQKLMLFFYDSATLGRRAAKAFFRALCDGVLTQIDSKSSGVFALQMLVVAASSNMNRSEREWASLWDALSGLFIKCCVHPNPNVACSAVDALRQIVAHFSETEEVDEKNQERALAPFVVAIADHESDTVRDFAVTALKSFISNNGWGKKLKSGWIPVLQSLRFAAEFNSSKSEGFSTLQLVFEKHHDVISNHFDLFVNALIAFQRTCGKESEEIAMKVTEITSQILLDVTVEEINDISEGDQLTLNGISYDSSFVEQRMISRTTQPLPSIAQNYLIQYMPLLTSLAASALSTYSNVSSFAIETIQKHIQTLPSQLQPIVFYRTIYRCFTPDIIQANTSTLESILTYSTTLPLTTILPVVSYCFNMLLNHLPSQSPCLHFLKTILQHPDFSTIHKQFLTLQIHYFEIALSSIRLDPPHNFTSQPRPKPSTTTPCHKCHTPHVTYLMKRCPGCLQEYYCTNCSDSHIIECIHTWKEWSLFHIAAPNVTYCGLTNYLTMLYTDVISSLLLDSITSLYANLKTNLATHTEALLDCFETVSKIMFRYRVALMPSAPELVTTELKEEFTSIASAIITGFTQTETKNIVLDALDVVTTLDDTNFLMICSTVIPQLIETILVDDVEVRKLVTKLFVRIFKLHPIML
ncbi:HEAT repeat containing protein [Entamoeba marina]